MEQFIQISNLTVAYGNKEVLHQLNLNIKQGMFGLLGRNGAGKTTLMKTIVGLLPIKTGHVNLCNISEKDLKARRAIIGYLPQTFDFYPNMSVKETLAYMGVLSGMSKKKLEIEVPQVLKALNMDTHQNKKIKALSGGMKRRLGIAQAILHEPRVLIVDEPTAGLDPEERIRFRHLLSDLAKERVVLLSTHIAEDIEKTCQQLAVLHEGRILYNGSLPNLLIKAEGLTYKATMSYEAFKTFKEKHIVINRQDTPEGVEVSFLYNGLPNEGFTSIPTNIESAYLNLIYDEGGKL